MAMPSAGPALSAATTPDELRDRLAALGHTFGDAEFEGILRIFHEVADKKDEVYDEDLESILRRYQRELNAIFVLDAVQISCGFPLTPTATVTLTNNETGQTDTACAYGTGPIDAVYKAVNQIVDVENDLADFSVKSITRGIDALGEVSVHVTASDGDVFTGFGSDGDIVVSATRAYLNALNRLVVTQRMQRQA